MSEERSQGRIINIDEGLVKSQLGEVVRETVEQTLNTMLDAEADLLCSAKRYELSNERVDRRAGQYERTMQSKAGPVKLKMPKLRTIPFESAIIDRFRRRECSVEEALMEMYLAGVLKISMTGTGKSSARPKVRKRIKTGWSSFIASVKERGLSGVQLFISDTCMGLVESLGEYYPASQWQRCTVHFYRNVFTNVPSTKVKAVAAMLKAIHAQEDREAALEKASLVVEKLKSMKLLYAAKSVEEGIRETLTYTAFPLTTRLPVATVR